MAGHGIDRVVFEHDQRAAGPEQALQLAEQGDVALCVDVVEDAGRKDQIKALRRQGDVLAVITHQLGYAREAASRHIQAPVGHVKSCDLSGREKFR